MIPALFWMKYNDLTVTSLGIMICKGNHPLFMAFIQVREILINIVTYPDCWCTISSPDVMIVCWTSVQRLQLTCFPCASDDVVVHQWRAGLPTSTYPPNSTTLSAHVRLFCLFHCWQGVISVMHRSSIRNDSILCPNNERDWNDQFFVL